MRVPAGYPAEAIAGGLVPRSVRQDAKPGVSERPYLRSRQQTGTLHPGIARKSPKKPPLARNSTCICSPSGFVFWGAALQHSVRRVHHQLELEQMTTVADGAPLYGTAGLSF